MHSEGRVEVCLDQQWGTVCHDSFGTIDASVVCKQLGFSRLSELSGTCNHLSNHMHRLTDATAFSNARFGPGTGPIHLDDVRCTGMEARLFDCPRDADTLDCSHADDAGVICTPNG